MPNLSQTYPLVFGSEAHDVVDVPKPKFIELYTEYSEVLDKIKKHFA